MSPTNWTTAIPSYALDDATALRRWALLNSATRIRLLLIVGRQWLREPELAELLELSADEMSRHVRQLTTSGFLRRHRRGRQLTNPPIWRPTDRALLLLRALLDPSDGKDSHQPITSRHAVRLAILAQLSTADDHGWTTKQLAVSIGVSWEAARRTVKAMVDAGLVEEAKHLPTGAHRKWSSTYTLTDAGRVALEKQEVSLAP